MEGEGDGREKGGNKSEDNKKEKPYKGINVHPNTLGEREDPLRKKPDFIRILTHRRISEFCVLGQYLPDTFSNG